LARLKALVEKIRIFTLNGAPHADGLPFLVIAAIVGSGLVSGLLLAFSVVIMRTRLQLLQEVGMQSMERINVPLNNRLANTPSNQAVTGWPKYASAWLRWNHVRTALGALTTVILCMGLVQGIR
jgi:uncharacterized membrane protein